MLWRHRCGKIVSTQGPRQKFGVWLKDARAIRSEVHELVGKVVFQSFYRCYAEEWGRGRVLWEACLGRRGSTVRRAVCPVQEDIVSLLVVAVTRWK
jgi:hypothetical protein